MTNTLLISAAEVAKELGVSKPYAYKLLQQLNDELKEKGYITIAGKVSRQYFIEKVYGMANQAQAGGE